MISKTLSQINAMSIQIQSCVKQAFSHIQQPTKNDFIPQPQTDYKLRNLSQQKDYEPSMEMRKFMFEEENQMLKRENMELTQKGREYRSQIKELKKHVKFLESYNDDLKKQVVLWMTRPAKKHQMGSIIEDRFNEYRLRLGDIMSRSTKTSKGNTTNVLHMDSKSQHDDDDDEVSTNFHTQQLYTLSQENGINRLSLQEKLNQKNTNLRKNQFYQLNQKKHSRNSQSHDGECTSCNYLQLVNKNRSKPLRKNSCFESFKKGRKANNMMMENNEIYGNGEKNKNKLCYSTKNPQEYLCPCHTNYKKSKKF